MDKLKWLNSIENLKKIENNENIKNFDRNILLKIINRYHSTTNKKIIDEIINVFEKENDVFKKELIIIKINSLLADIGNIKYNKKITNDEYSLYYYTDRTNLYLKQDTTPERLFDILVNMKIKKFKLVELNKNKNKRNLLKISNERTADVELLKKEIKSLLYNQYYIICKN